MEGQVETVPLRTTNTGEWRQLGILLIQPAIQDVVYP